jgi:UDP-hydrolysing UDP-N-acetyl-D-glucosamine 2-epimerase
MNKRKIAVVVASRANYGRIRSVLRAIDNHPKLELLLIVGASALLYRFGSVVELIEEDGFKIASKIYTVVEGETPTTMAKSVGLSIIELSTQFENLKPDIVLTVADRYETMATAIAASYMNIPVAHTQGGELTGSIDESVRHAITKLSHIHFPATELSKERLIKMGENPNYIFNLGCPAMDEIAEIDLGLGFDFFNRSGGSGDAIDQTQDYVVVLQHPVTTEYGKETHNILETIEAIKTVEMQTVWLWPNIDAGSDDISKQLRQFSNSDKCFPLRLYRNFNMQNYTRLIYNAKCLVGNSSSGIREAAFLGVPSVNIGNRQLGRERGTNVIDVPNDRKKITDAINKQILNGKCDIDKRFGDGNSGVAIAEILATVNPSIQKTMTY